MITLDSLTLPDELIWIDEYAWQKVRVNEKLSLSGVRNVFENKLPSYSGRPITLTSDYAWIKKSDLNTLYSWAEILDKDMTLTLHDLSEYTVRFRHIEQPVVDAEQILNTAFISSDTYYNLTIKLEVK